MIAYRVPSTPWQLLTTSEGPNGNSAPSSGPKGNWEKGIQAQDP